MSTQLKPIVDESVESVYEVEATPRNDADLLKFERAKCDRYLELNKIVTEAGKEKESIASYFRPLTQAGKPYDITFHGRAIHSWVLIEKNHKPTFDLDAAIQAMGPVDTWPKEFQKFIKPASKSFALTLK